MIGTGPGHGIRLSTGPHAGRLVVPTWLALGTAGNGHHPSQAATIFSDDDGKTWQRGDFFARNTKDIIDPNETSIVQLSDGRVIVNTRTDTPTHRRLITISPDGATHWPVQKVGSAEALEHWVPADELDEFNRQIMGVIETMHEFR